MQSHAFEKPFSSNGIHESADMWLLENSMRITAAVY